MGRVPTHLREQEPGPAPPNRGADDSDDPANAEINYVDGLKAGTSYADVAR
ncbi:hypothetical protein [Streptomyces sp. NPDC005077]|uniref:hypothetical protein n=1 Tax=Streptomyces sp. NPDC005077 TaxID=3154292 RepID=UPI0033A05A89